MGSLSVRELFRQARGIVADNEDSLYGDMDGRMADAITCLFEAMAESEVERRAGVKLYERGPDRQAHRNGYRYRRTQTSFTTVTIRIPRLRERGFVPSFLEPNRRAIQTTERFVTGAYLCGISRAEIIRLMEQTTGCRPSEGLLRRVQADLDERTEVFRKRPLTGAYAYLFLDAAYVKDIVGNGARRICVLTALAVREDGTREILGFERAGKECQASWSRFLSGLVGRGFDVNKLKLVISDEHEGILAAVQEVFGDVAHQLCWAHRCRNLYKQVNKCDAKQMADSLRAIYQAQHLTAARGAFQSLKVRWAEAYPKLVANTEQDLGHLLAFFDCDPLNREYVRTSNPIERCFLELRRSRFACGAFANRKSCDRVVTNVFMRLNRQWDGQDIWMERKRRAKSKALRHAGATDLPAHDRSVASVDEPLGPVSGAQVALQQSPTLPDGYGECTLKQPLVPAVR